MNNKDISSLSIKLTDNNKRQIYLSTTEYVLPDTQPKALIEIKPSSFPVACDVDISVSIYPQNSNIKNKILDIIQNTYPRSTRCKTQDIFRQYNNFKEHESPDISLYGLTISNNILPTTLFILSLLCIHFLYEYINVTKNILKKFQTYSKENYSKLFEVLPLPIIYMYKNKIYYPFKNKFIITISLLYIALSFLFSLYPRLLTDDNGPSIILKTGVFSTIFIEGIIIVLSLLILKKAFDKIPNSFENIN